MKFGETKSALSLPRKASSATASQKPQASIAPTRARSINWRVLDNEGSTEREGHLGAVKEEDEHGDPSGSSSADLTTSIKGLTLDDEDGYTVVKKPIKTFSSRLQKIVFPRTERPRGTIIGTKAALTVYTAKTKAPTRMARSRWQPGTRAITGKTTRHPVESGLSVESLRRGAIIEYIDTREYNNNHKENSSDGEVFTSPEGQKYLRKPRFWIVTSNNRHAWHVNTVPIYSYHGQGCLNKPDKLKREHVGIFPYNMEEGEEYVKQSEHEPLKVAFMKARDVKLRKESVVHFTEQHSFDFGRRARLIGFVEEESMERLEGLCGEFGC